MPESAKGPVSTEDKAQEDLPQGPEIYPSFCTGCGSPLSKCPGCRLSFDPPRFCPYCGKRLTVYVSPTTWRARCVFHGEIVLSPTDL